MRALSGEKAVARLDRRECARVARAAILQLMFEFFIVLRILLLSPPVSELIAAYDIESAQKRPL